MHPQLLHERGSPVAPVANPLYPKPYSSEVERDAIYREEPLAGYAINAELRGVVSRWGFDPVWNDARFGPLTVDHFESRAEGVTYEHVDLTELDPNSSQPPAQSARPVWLALHDVHYDGAKDRWYTDVLLSLRGEGRKKQALPFVQLALATYQSHGIPGKRTSPVALCDMYKTIGERVLEIERKNRGHLTIRLTGDFDEVSNQAPWPRRKVLATVAIRDSSLPAEVARYVPPRQTRAPKVDPDWANQRDDGSVDRSAATGPIREVCLKKSTRGGVYSGAVKIDDDAFGTLQSKSGRVLTLSINEYEIFPAAEGSLDSTGDGLAVIDDQICASRLVYTYSFDLT